MIREFASRSCRPLGADTPPMPSAAIAATLQAFPGWALEHGAIAKTFSFPDYYQTIAFVNALAWMVHGQDHHPELVVRFNSCRVAFDTHSIGGVSENDFICAARIEELFA
ncbi:MAG: 4a-hydroxytetrahydrobiopterin dehydratase [Burkholderiales bacterium]